MKRNRLEKRERKSVSESGNVIEKSGPKAHLFHIEEKEKKGGKNKKEGTDREKDLSDDVFLVVIALPVVFLGGIFILPIEKIVLSCKADDDKEEIDDGKKSRDGFYDDLPGKDQSEEEAKPDRNQREEKNKKDSSEKNLLVNFRNIHDQS